VTGGHACCISASQWIPIPAGNLAGPLRAGLDQRIANDTDTRPSICYSEYAGNGSRVGVVPLIEPAGSGVTQVRVTGFLRVFIPGPTYGNSDVVAEFVAGPTPAVNPSWGRTKIRYH
jgi:hypothetical protein